MSFIIIADTQNGACCSGEGTALQFDPQTLTSEQLEKLRQLLGTGAAGGAQELTTSEVVKLLTHRISVQVSPQEMMGLTSVFGSSDWLLPAREGTLTVGRAVEMLAEKVYRARAAEGGVAATSEGGVVSASPERPFDPSVASKEWYNELLQYIHRWTLKYTFDSRELKAGVDRWIRETSKPEDVEARLQLWRTCIAPDWALDVTTDERPQDHFFALYTKFFETNDRLTALEARKDASDIMEKLNEKFAKYNEAFKSIQEFLQSGAGGAAPANIWEQKATGETLGDRTMLSYGEYVLGGTDNTAEHSLRDVVAALVNGQRYAYEKLSEHSNTILDITSNPDYTGVFNLPLGDKFPDWERRVSGYLQPFDPVGELPNTLMAAIEKLAAATASYRKREQMLHDVVQDLISNGQLSYEKYTDKEYYGGASFSEG